MPGMKAPPSSCSSSTMAASLCQVPAADGSVIFTLKARRQGNAIAVSGEGEARLDAVPSNIPQVAGVQGGTQTGSEWGWW